MSREPKILRQTQAETFRIKSTSKIPTPRFTDPKYCTRGFDAQAVIARGLRPTAPKVAGPFSARQNSPNTYPALEKLQPGPKYVPR